MLGAYPHTSSHEITSSVSKNPVWGARPWYISSAIGFTIGMVEVSVNHPLWALKTRQQAKYLFTLSPRILYQGFWAHAASSVPVDVLQVTVSRLAMDTLFPEAPAFSIGPRLMAGFIGGCAAGLIACPTEMIMTRQQLNLTFYQATKVVLKEGGYPKIFAGFFPTLVRDGIFCSGFYGGIPLIKNPLKAKQVDEISATVASGAFAGVLTAVVSQPFDTIKTTIQASPTPLKFLKCGADLFKQEGLKGIFNGLGLRIARVTSSVFILGTMNDYLESKYENYRASLM